MISSPLTTMKIVKKLAIKEEQLLKELLPNTKVPTNNIDIIGLKSGIAQRGNKHRTLNP